MDDTLLQATSSNMSNATKHSMNATNSIARHKHPTCTFHPHEAQVFYYKAERHMLCCKCLAALRDRVELREVTLAEDYCKEWLVKWRELLKESTLLSA